MNDLFLQKPMTKKELEEKLMLFTPRNITLVLNENHSTFLSVLQKRRKELKLSLHSFFLYASDWVCEAVIRYSVRRDLEALKILRLFTNKHFAEADYSSKVNTKRLVTKGAIYDLQKIYDRVNDFYFDGKLDLFITWFKKPRYRNFSSLTYGSYSKPLRLIRVNNLLDTSHCPEYFVEYIVYHEMLHEVCPPKTDRLGRSWIHTREFKQREKDFLFFKEALHWEKTSKTAFIKKVSYGRT